MRSGPVSISDIAKALDVAVSTVSRALKNHPDISLDTRRRVQEYAEKVHYRPNVLALGLKKQQSNTLGIIIPEIVHHFFSSIISGIEDLAYGNGYRVMICQSNEDYLREVINLQALMDHRVDGLLVSISKSTLDINHFQRVADSGAPIVFLDRVCAEIPTDRVVTDDYEGARMLVAHLIERGCQRIMHLSASQHLTVGRERFAGYRKALQDAGLPMDEDLVIHCDTPEKVIARKKDIISMAKSADGLFAVNDFTAVAAMRLLRENGYEIPADIAVGGFGDDPIAKMVSPSLTTVEQKGYEMGYEAARLLIERLRSTGNVEFRTKTFSAGLKIRDSG